MKGNSSKQYYEGIQLDFAQKQQHKEEEKRQAALRSKRLEAEQAQEMRRQRRSARGRALQENFPETLTAESEVNRLCYHST
mmetsp:Transcript_12656/g.18158  ORF Transcript_12656/g.18158 Transcript_12656/m.18158 type:complete len:81 (+) Transcript_12656:1-243(+)